MHVIWRGLVRSRRAMISTNHQLFSADPPVSFLKNLKVWALEPEEYQRAGELLDREHYLGDVPQGRQLLQAVEYAGQWVALLDWGAGDLETR